ncbi:hypothetical protein GC173_13195 [bacterium]|nr:hypothetical protein [bacterium]
MHPPRSEPAAPRIDTPGTRKPIPMSTRPLPTEQRKPRLWPLLAILACLLLIGIVKQTTTVLDFRMGGLDPLQDAITRAERQAGGLDDAVGRKRPTFTMGSAAHVLPPTPISRIPDDEGSWPETVDEATSTSLEVAELQPLTDLNGWVSDTRGIAVPDAKVTLTFEDEKTTDKEKTKGPTATTSSNGTFRIEDVAPGRWTIMAEKKGYASAVETGFVVQPFTNTPAVDLRLGEELILKGTVTAGGKLVSGAVLEARRSVPVVYSEGRIANNLITYSTSSSDDKGAFELGQLPPGKMTLCVTANGYARVEKEITLVADLKPVEIKLESEALLSGFIRDEAGRNIRGAELLLRVPGSDPKGDPWAKTTSSGEGTFEFAGLPAGRAFDLYASAKRYAALGPVTVVSGTNTTVIVMTAGGAIMGKVINFETYEPVAGISVRATSEDGSLAQPVVTETTSEGTYRITRLPAGVYQVSLASDRLTADPKGGIKVTAGAAVRDIDLTTYPGLGIAGDVVDGDSGQWLANATVNLTGKVGPNFTTNRTAKTTADQSGSFSFMNLPQGIYTVTAGLTGYTAATGVDASARVELLRDQLVPPIRLKLLRAGTIDGLVVDAGGSIVPNAVIQLSHFSGTPSSVPNLGNYNTTSNTGGRFRIENLPLSAEVHLRASAWADGYPKGQSDRIVLDRQQANASATIVLGAGVPVNVTVRSTQGVSIGDAQVSLAHRSFADGAPPAWSAKTNSSGAVTFEQIPEGSIWVSASRDGFIASGISGTVALPDPTSLVIELEPATTFGGRVADDRANAVTSGNVTARGLSGATGGGSGGIASDGKFLIKGLGKGQFWLEVDARRKSTTGNRQVIWAVPKITPNGGASEYLVTVPMSGALTGSVMLPETDPNPPGKYSVTISGSYTDPTGRGRGVGETASFDVGHDFRFDCLPPGEYRVTATAANYLPATVGPFKVVSPGETSAGSIHLRPGGSFKARVLNAQTREPIAGALVALKTDGPSAKTNGSGDVSMSPVTPGIYTVEVSHGEYLGQKQHLISVSRGQEADMGEILLDPGAILGGVVSDPAGDPIRSVRVDAQSVEVPDDLRRVYTDASGKYLFRGLVPGGQILTFTATINSRPITRSYNVVVTTAHPTEQNVTLAASSTLYGWLSAPSSVDVSRAIVRAYQLGPGGVPNTSYTISTNARSGSTFRIDNLVEGRYLVTVQAPRLSGTHYWSSPVTVEGADSRATINCGTATIEGHIADRSGGSSVVGQPVRVEFLSTPASGVSALRNWWLYNLTTDQDGFFELPLAQPGAYSIVATNAELGSDVLDVVTVNTGDALVPLEYDFGRKASPITPPSFKMQSIESYAPDKEVFGGGN